MKRLLDLLPAFGPYRYRVAFGLVCILAAAWLGLLTPLLVGRAIDELRLAPSWLTFARYGGLLLGITAIQGLFSFSQRRTLVAVSRDIEFDLRGDFFAHLERQPPAFFHTRFTGDLMARATSDLGAVRMLCGPAIMYAGNTFFASLGALVLMARIDLALTAVALATMPVVALVTKLVGERVHARYEAVQSRFADLTARVQESFSGARVVRAYAQETREEGAFGEVNLDYVERNRRLARWSMAFHPTLQALIGVSFVAVLWVGGEAVRSGAITLGELVSFQLFLGKLAWPMIAIGWVINLAQRGAASYARLREIVDVVPAIRDQAPLVDVTTVRGALEVRDLSLTYPGRADPAVAGVSFRIAPGERVAIVGRTGSGKSSLLSSFARLLDPPEGAVFIDGVDVRRWPLGRLRRAVAMVPQETFLFSATVRENIAFGVPEAPEARVRWAVSIAALDDDIGRWPQGLDTVVGERGVTLSGGQKQRVALARALLRGGEVLVLDDPFSAVDPRTEAQILDRLAASAPAGAGASDGELAPRPTILLVSHRVATIRSADRILVLERGRLVEEGSHSELVIRGGFYSELVRHQELIEEIETLPELRSAGVES